MEEIEKSRTFTRMEETKYIKEKKARKKDEEN